MYIVIDSREKRPLQFLPAGDLEGVKIDKLSVGDYSIRGLEQDIAIERKSLQDAFGTLGKGHIRFAKELKKSMNLEFFAIVIEGSFTEFRDKNFENAHFCKMRPDVAMNVLMNIMYKYNVHIFFCKDRFEATSLIRKLLISFYLYKKNIKQPLNITDAKWLSEVMRLRRKLRLDR